MTERALARSYQSVGNFELQNAQTLAEHVAERFAPVRIEPVGRADLLSMSGTYGQVAGIDFSRSSVKGEFKLFPERRYEGMFFMFPTRGNLVFHQSRNSLTSSPTLAVAADGMSCGAMEFLLDTAFCSIVVDRPTFAARLSSLLGRPIIERPVFDAFLDMASGPASALKSLVECITGPEFGPQLNRTSLTVERVREVIVDLVLEVWPNSYSEMLHRPAPMIAPQHVKLAVDFIHEHAQVLPSGTELAQLSGVSLRALQAGFRRFVGLSIGAYQRQIRLERARADLLREPGVSIEEIALRWGFTNSGRFSRYFKEAYGVFPTELVRQGNRR